MRTILLTSLALMLFSCKKEHATTTTEIIKQDYKFLGDSIADTSQKALLSKVSAAIKKGGTEYAVEFCNLNAVPLTDSLSKVYNVEIQRITDKNRNRENMLKTETDRKTLAYFKENTDASGFLAEENGTSVYYKRINLAMPTCIKCHGVPEKDINTATMKKILEKYPTDKAIGYAMGDFRGMWKLTFRK